MKAEKGAVRRKFTCGRIRPLAELLDKATVILCM
jgi:hypothetical protein